MMERGNIAEQEKQLEKMRSKIDERIEKLVEDKDKIKQLHALKGKALPDEILKKLDRPNGPGPGPGPGSGPGRGQKN